MRVKYIKITIAYTCPGRTFFDLDYKDKSLLGLAVTIGTIWNIKIKAAIHQQSTTKKVST